MDFLKDLSIDKVRNLAEDAYNQAKPKTDVEARVYEVLSHKNWGASSSLMHEIARDTFDLERFHVITRLMWESLENQRPAAWKVVFKGLTLLEFLIKNGAERCVDDARNHGVVLRGLGQFNYYEGTIDRGLGVREKSKQILEILGDDERVREERQKARKLREKFNGKDAVATGGGGAYAGYGNQDSWNTGGGEGGVGSGYGQGGIDSSSPYESGGGYSGRYGGSSGASAGRGDVGQATPTFAAMPDEGKKKKTKKKKKKPEESQAPPASEPAVDLFSFDAPPAPAPLAPAGSEEFGAFQSTPAPALASPPAAAKDQFADFGSLRSAPALTPQVDPFAAAPSLQQPQVASFDAFGNNNAMGSGMAGMNNAFGSMSLGQQPPQQQQQAFMGAPTPQAFAATGGDDEFGDFAAAAPKISPVKLVSPADPMAKLVSLDGLSKNPQRQTARDASFSGIDGLGNASPNFMTNAPNNNLPSLTPVVSAGGRDAITSLMGPPPVPMPQMGLQVQGMAQQQGVPKQQQGMPSQQYQQMQQGMQQGTTPQTMQQMNPQMMSMMGGQQMMGGQMGGGGGMMSPNMMGGQQMMGGQMGGGGGMMSPNMMGNQQQFMGGQMGGGMMNPNMMGGGMMNPNMYMGGQMGGGMQGGMPMGQMGGQQQQQWR